MACLGVRHTNCGPANVVYGRVGAEGPGGGGGGVFTPWGANYVGTSDYQATRNDNPSLGF